MMAAVRRGGRYRARVRLGIFESIASNAAIAEKFVDAGFTVVSVSGSGRDRWAFGTWPGADASAELPEQIKEVVEL